MRTNKQASIKSNIYKYLSLFIMGLIAISSYSQARIIINNASFINISNGSFLVVDNNASNAITRIGNTGWIISEGTIGNNRVKWNIGTSAATYIVPFGFGTTIDLPLTFTTSGALGNGSIISSTFRSGINSSSLPTAGTVVPQTMLPTSYLSSGADNSAFGVDRFYQIDATDAIFTTRPTLSNIIFSYATSEFDASITPNTITEGNLQAQYWDNTATDWRPLTPLGTVTTGSNIVTVASHSAVVLARSKWWSLVDNSNPLPISLINFTGECLNKTIEIKWSTLTEINNDFFTIEKSIDGINWQTISKVNGAGNSSSTVNYSLIDINNSFKTSYYRLKQTDIDGSSTASSIISVGECNDISSPLSTNAYFNTDNKNVQVSIKSDISAAFSITIYNAVGSLIASKDIISVVGKNQVFFKNLNQPAGFYFVIIRNSQKVSSHKILIPNL